MAFHLCHCSENLGYGIVTVILDPTPNLNIQCSEPSPLLHTDNRRQDSLKLSLSILKCNIKQKGYITILSTDVSIFKKYSKIRAYN